MKKQSKAKATNSIWGVRTSTQPGVYLELEGFGVTSFDPRDVQVNTKKSSTVGGYTSIYLTAVDVRRLLAACRKEMAGWVKK